MEFELYSVGSGESLKTVFKLKQLSNDLGFHSWPPSNLLS